MPASPGSEPFARLTWNRSKREPFEPAVLKQWGQARHGSSSNCSQGHLYLGESASVMLALLADYEGKIDLIYIDPPFLTGNAYHARIGRGEDSRRPEDWETTPGYQDTWETGAEYLEMLYRRLELMYRLLSPTGSLYLHLDWHASAYARVMLDEIFGPERLLNEIVWVYHGPSPIKSAFNRKHDTILLYTKSKDYTFNADDVRVPYKDSTLKTFASSPKAGFGKKPNLKRGKVPEDWWYFPVVARLHSERTGYPTQKPEAMLERVIRASTNPGDLVADFFVGSGTTVNVAANLSRRWLACDASPLALSTTYRRLLLNEQACEIQLWKDLNLGIEDQLQLQVELHDGPDEWGIELKAAYSLEDPPIEFPDDVTLWEVDWDHDGAEFRSSQQAVRDWRDGDLGLRLTRSQFDKKPDQIAIRLFDNRGRFGHKVVRFTSG
ncbi:MAG: site-specific DNA-methyltransferase [Anaerolineales bacterium]|nr:site-specific DNA-methyltransferase [Anaerolineales bacterium]